MNSKTQNVLQRHLCSLQRCSDKLPLCGQLETIEIIPSVLPHYPKSGRGDRIGEFFPVVALLLFWLFKTGL